MKEIDTMAMNEQIL